LGVSTVIMQNCTANANMADGFNLHWQNSILCNGVFIDCVANRNGLTGDEDNGFTVHDGGSMIVIGGTASANLGPNVIPSAAYAWCLGVTATSSAASIAGARLNFNSAGESGAMWCDRCISSGSDYDYNAGVSTTLYKRLCTGAAIDGGAGEIEAY